MQLPILGTISGLATRWKSILDPLLANPTNGLLILPPINLISGVTIVNHMLGRQQQGWIQLDVNAYVIYFRSQPFNDKTITFTANTAATIIIGVY